MSGGWRADGRGLGGGREVFSGGEAADGGCVGVAVVLCDCDWAVGVFSDGAVGQYVWGEDRSCRGAVDFGDGPRHPTQLYESGFAVVMLFVLWWVSRRRWVRGGFVSGVYGGIWRFRFLVEVFEADVEAVLMGL